MFAALYFMDDPINRMGLDISDDERFMISASGNRGWIGNPDRQAIFYTIKKNS